MSLTKRTSYHYHLPQNLIAQHPFEKRDECRLLHIPKNGEQLHHLTFKEITGLLHSDDILVINTSKVIPARLIGYKETGAKVESLLLREMTDNRWECLVKPANRLHPGDVIVYPDKQGNPLLRGTIVKCEDEGYREIVFSWDENETFLNCIEKIGRVPLPPYIKRDEQSFADNSTGSQSQEDKDYYQTVYANVPGSAAAPTAGMHFTEDLLAEIKSKGVQIVPVILHIGVDTFRPVKVENILQHKMHREYCTIPQESAQIINEAKRRGNRIIAVGTTVTRTLESFALLQSDIPYVTAGSKWSDLFIYPGFNFKIIDGLLTNFHLPESSLLMLVAAFCGYERIMAAYQIAVTEKYRFFSYGDAMLIDKPVPTGA